jgi:hypothetical protein
MSTYKQLNNKIEIDTRYFFCCCLEEKTSVIAEKNILIIHKQKYNMCGCDTGESTSKYLKNEIASIKSNIGWCCDPTPFELFSYITKSCNCSKTTITINTAGVKSDFRVKQGQEKFIQEWWESPVQQEMV